MVDGVTSNTLETAHSSWRVAFGDELTDEQCHMIWVSSQQVVLPMEQLRASGMAKFSFVSWTKEEVHQFAQGFSMEQKEEFQSDVLATKRSDRNEWDPAIDFDQAVKIKMYYCGCSARWMFGLNMRSALEDIDQYLVKVNDAKLVQNGLQGSRSEDAVNHLIAMYPVPSGASREFFFTIASNYVVQRLSERVGLEAIRAMYSSHWVQDNP